jgi:hypothetical protein
MAEMTFIPEFLMDAPEAWTRATLPPGAGRRRVGLVCLEELLAAVAAIRANPLPVLSLSPDDFELPACRHLMSEVKRVLDHGVGFVVLDGLPLDRLTPDEAVCCHWLLGRLLARPVAQKWDGTMVYDVLDTGRPSTWGCSAWRPRWRVGSAASSRSAPCTSRCAGSTRSYCAGSIDRSTSIVSASTRPTT